jgi:hypothetical protein
VTAKAGGKNSIGEYRLALTKKVKSPLGENVNQMGELQMEHAQAKAVLDRFGEIMIRYLAQLQGQVDRYELLAKQAKQDDSEGLGMDRVASGANAATGLGQQVGALRGPSTPRASGNVAYISGGSSTAASALPALALGAGAIASANSGDGGDGGGGYANPAPFPSPQAPPVSVQMGAHLPGPSATAPTDSTQVLTGNAGGTEVETPVTSPAGPLGSAEIEFSGASRGLRSPVRKGGAAAIPPKGEELLQSFGGSLKPRPAKKGEGGGTGEVSALLGQMKSLFNFDDESFGGEMMSGPMGGPNDSFKPDRAPASQRESGEIYEEEEEYAEEDAETEEDEDSQAAGMYAANTSLFQRVRERHRICMKKGVVLSALPKDLE